MNSVLKNFTVIVRETMITTYSLPVKAPDHATACVTTGMRLENGESLQKYVKSCEKHWDVIQVLGATVPLPLDIPDEVLPTRAVTALNAAWKGRKYSLVDVASMTADEFRKLEHVGRGTVDQTRAVLRQYGLAFKGETLSTENDA